MDTPALDAHVLIGHVIGLTAGQVGLRLDTELLPRDVRAIEIATQRREQREPVAYIIGSKAFRRLEIAVNRHVLIPRPETELLVEVGLDLWDASPDATAVDIGTGSGAIALALADERRGRRVVGTDCSPAALRVAASNVQRLRLTDSVKLYSAGGAAGLDLEGVVMLANLPYVPSAMLPALQPEVSRWEPRVALDGGPDGLSVIRPVIAQLVHDEVHAAAFEIGFGQAAVVAELLRRAGFGQTVVHRDLAGEPRVVSGTRVS